MRRFFVIGLLTLMFASCYEDKGNYTYTKVMTVTIPSMNSYIKNRNAIYGELFTAYPPLRFANYENPEDTLRLKYYWVSSNVKDSKKLDTLCIGRKLEWVCDRVGSALGVYLFVEDTVTGQSVNGLMQVTCQSQVGQGWAFLHNYSNGSDMSFIRPYSEQVPDPEDPNLKITVKKYADNYRNYLSTIVTPGVPLGLDATNFNFYGNRSATKIVVLQDHSPVTLNGSTWKPEVYLAEEFVGGMPEGGFKDMIYLEYAKLLLAKDGRLYRQHSNAQSSFNSSFYTDSYINVPMQDVDTGEDLIIESLEKMDAGWRGTTMCAYDKINNRILWTQSRNSGNCAEVFYPPYSKDLLTLSNFLDEESMQKYIDLSNMGQNQLLIMGLCGATGITNSSLSASVQVFFIKNPDGKIVVQIVKQDTQMISELIKGHTTVQRPNFKQINVYDWTTIEGATDDMLTDKTVHCFTHGKKSANDFFFFAKGNEIYAYDFQSKLLRKIYEFEDAGTTAKFMEVNPQDTELGIYASDNTFRTIKCSGSDNANSDYQGKVVGKFTDLKDVVAMKYLFANWSGYEQLTND